MSDGERMTKPDLPSNLHELSKTLDDLENAGHEMTLVAGPIAGIQTYWCEGCGCIATTNQGKLDIFQVPAWSRSDTEMCQQVRPKDDSHGPTLKTKLVAKAWAWTKPRIEGEVRTIMIDGSPREVTALELTYSEVVTLARGLVRGGLLTITYCRGADIAKPEGILSPGGKVAIKDGTNFNTAYTGNA